MSKDRKKRKIAWQQYIGMAFMVLLGAVCGAVIVSYLDKFNDGASLYQMLFTYAVLFIGVYFALFFHLIVHEAGHLLFGLMTGYKFSSFRIASFMWLKENGRLRLKRLSLAGTGGQCLMSPPDIKDGKIPLVLYNLGGSIINVVVGAVFLVGYLLCRDIPFLSLIFLVLAVTGAVIAIMNGIPMRMGTVDNDGYNAFALSKNKEAVEAFWIQLKISEQNSKGVRLKDMPAEWFTVPTDEAMKNSLVAACGVFACNRLMDEERFEEADALMAHLIEIESGMVGLYHDLLVCDRIYVELIGENRREVIQKMMTKQQKNFMKAMKRFPSVLRTEYVLALLFENNAEKAEKVREEFERAAKTYPYSQDIEAERELMDIAGQKAAIQR